MSWRSWSSRRRLVWVVSALVVSHLPAQEPQVTRVCAGGDMMLGSNLPPRGGAPPEVSAPSAGELLALVAPLAPMFADAHVAVLNVEGAIGEGVASRKCSPSSTSCWAFRQPVASAAAYRQVAPQGVVVGTVANNHALDAGPAGWRATAGHLRDAGVAVAGMDSLPTMIAVPSGDSVAVLAFSTFAAGPDARNLAAVRRHVARAVERTPLVVVSVHHGAEGRGAQRTADRVETYLGENRGNPIAFATAAVDAGASLVIGHGPHVLRAGEWRGDALVLYSLGNLLTNGPFGVGEPNGRGAVVCADLRADGRVTGGVVRSTRQTKPGLLSADAEARAAVLIDSLGRLDFPVSGLRVEPSGSFRRAAPPPLADTVPPAPSAVGRSPRDRRGPR